MEGFPGVTGGTGVTREEGTFTVPSIPPMGYHQGNVTQATDGTQAMMHQNQEGYAQVAEVYQHQCNTNQARVENTQANQQHQANQARVENQYQANQQTAQQPWYDSKQATMIAPLPFGGNNANTVACDERLLQLCQEMNAPNDQETAIDHVIEATADNFGPTLDSNQDDMINAMKRAALPSHSSPSASALMPGPRQMMNVYKEICQDNHKAVYQATAAAAEGSAIAGNCSPGAIENNKHIALPSVCGQSQSKAQSRSSNTQGQVQSHNNNENGALPPKQDDMIDAMRRTALPPHSPPAASAPMPGPRQLMNVYNEICQDNHKAVYQATAAAAAAEGSAITGTCSPGAVAFGGSTGAGGKTNNQHHDSMLVEEGNERQKNER